MTARIVYTVSYLPVVYIQNSDGNEPQPKNFPIRSIMSAILQAAGPVAITNSLRQNRKIFRNLSAQQFLEAANELQDIGLGNLVDVTTTGSCTPVFVKNPPEMVEDSLNANPDLCDLGVYTTRYNSPASKSISFTLRGKLVAMKLVSKNHFM